MTLTVAHGGALSRRGDIGGESQGSMLPQSHLLGFLFGMLSLPSAAAFLARPGVRTLASAGMTGQRYARRGLVTLDLPVGPRTSQGPRKRASLGFLSALLWRSGAAEQQCLAKNLLSLAGGAQSRALGTCAAAPTAAETAQVLTKEKKQHLQAKYRASYRQPDYWVRQTDLKLEILPDPKDPSATITYVTSKLTVERNAIYSDDSRPNLELDGEVRHDGDTWHRSDVTLFLLLCCYEPFALPTCPAGVCQWPPDSDSGQTGKP